MKQTRPELKFLKKARNYPSLYHALETAPMEGFEYFWKNGQEKIRDKNISAFAGVIKKYIRSIFKEIRNSYKDLNPYFDELDETDGLSPSPFMDKFPNQDLWDQMRSYIDSMFGNVLVGFTEMPREFIFKDKTVFFRYSLVIAHEMNKDKIDTAPEREAGDETINIYNELGIVINDVANWLRAKGIKCHANHPLGGLVNTPPLAGKAGLGWQGQHGMLVTPEFGTRQRLAPIFVQERLFEFTDNDNHRWIENFCAKCGKCVEECPEEAINTERKVSISNVPGIGETKTCIDREKCKPYFDQTVGCSVCVKVCPFSQGPHMYEKMKKSFQNVA